MKKSKSIIRGRFTFSNGHVLETKVSELVKTFRRTRWIEDPEKESDKEKTRVDFRVVNALALPDCIELVNGRKNICFQVTVDGKEVNMGNFK